MNFNSTGNGGQSGKIINQLYFRQAFQTLVNQPAYIQHIDQGLRRADVRAGARLPEEQLRASELSSRQPVSRTTRQRRSSSSSERLDGERRRHLRVCRRCEVRRAGGNEADFTLQYVGGSPFEDQLMQAEKSSWAQAGIHMSLTTGTFNTVLSTAVPCKGSGCGWEVGNWGGGWIFSPDYYPSGELLFQTDAASNSGSYSDKTDGHADQGHHGRQLRPQRVRGLSGRRNCRSSGSRSRIGATEINKKLQGVTPLNPLTNINPENWYFTK